MSDIEKFLSKGIVYKDNNPVVTYGTLLAMGIGAGILYYCIPERKRKNLF